MTRKKKTMLAFFTIALGAATLAFAVLPATNVDPSTVPLGTLAGRTPVNVLSVDAFTRAINQGHGTNAVLQHIQLGPNQSTGWHTHPGPNIVFVGAGSATLMDAHCSVTTYGVGQAFATGLEVHEVTAGAEGVDVYTFYFLPANADVLRTDADPPVCATP
jgi:quercetin dioxygenase-like cupin family protein